MLRNLIRSALLDASYLLQWAIECLTPDDPTPLGVLGREIRPSLQSDICEDCSGECGVCQTLDRERYYAPKDSGFDGGSAYHARADRE